MKNPASLVGKTVLIVEDEDELREPLALEFESLGSRVFQASNGVQGYDIITQQDIDVVISDIRMPGGDGIEMLSKIKALPRRTPVVMLITGFSDVSLEETYARGAEAILAKPFDLDDIETTVERLLTPPAERWAAPFAPPERIKRHLERTCESLEAAAREGVLSLGKGGFFLGRPQPHEKTNVGNLVSFHVTFDKGEALVFEGTGILRWVRPQETAELQSGCGIEFCSLAPNTRDAVLRLVEKLPSPSYLPRNAP